MSRLHLHITVRDMQQNIHFYSALFNQAPTVEKPDYVKWELSDPAVNFAISTHGMRTGIDHVGIQVNDESELTSLTARLQDAGIRRREQTQASCCYARSDKHWLHDPQGIAWETFHTHGSSPTFAAAGEQRAAGGCCPPASGAGCC